MDESGKRRLRVGVCVPTIRETQIKAFIDQWVPFWSSSAQQDFEVTLFIHEDRPLKEFCLARPIGVCVEHTCQSDIPSLLGKRDWIIPRNSGASRSLPMYLAWQRGSEYVVTLDDDCYPDESASMFLASHISAFSLDRWFLTIDGEYPRGVPYGNRGHLPVLVNHGLWTNVPDLDGPTSLFRARTPTEVKLRPLRQVVPPGMWFTLCAMNVCYHRDAIPAAYNLLMGLETVGFDRFDDIWSGLFIKRVADHVHRFVTSGTPLVRHARASNAFMNNRKEALGLQVHEEFWSHIEAAPLRGATIRECYRELANWVGLFQPQTYGLQPGYFDRLSEAMFCWADLFE